MLLLRILFFNYLFLVALVAQEKNSVLDVYYQSLLNTGSFYYELDVSAKDDYVKKILNDDLTLDNVVDIDPTEEKGDLSSSDVVHQKLEDMDYFLELQDIDFHKSKIVVYKELKETSYISVAKLLKLDAKSDVNDQGKKVSLNTEIILTSFKTSKEEVSHSPFIVSNFDINYLDYFMIYYNHYNFELIKVTSDNYFYKGTLRDKEEELFDDVQIKVSKKYDIPTRIVLKNSKNKTSINVEVEKVEKIGEVYTGSKFSIYDSGKKITLSAHSISLGIPIDIENNYKISFNEYIDLTADAK